MKKKRTPRLASRCTFPQNQKRENLIPASVLFAKDVKVMSLLERQRNLPLKSSLRQQSNEMESCVGLQMVLRLYGICLVMRRTQVHVTFVLQSTRSNPRFPISRVIVVKETRAVDFLDLQQTLYIGQSVCFAKREHTSVCFAKREHKRNQRILSTFVPSRRLKISERLRKHKGMSPCCTSLEALVTISPPQKQSIVRTVTLCIF